MSRTKRNLIIIGSIVGFFVLLTVVFGALFSLRTIKVDYRSMDLVDEYLYQEEDILKTASIKKGKNIIFLDTEEYENNLEEKFSYARFKIVRNFPNQITIYVYKREAVFKVENALGNYEIYDADFKCLNIIGAVSMTEEEEKIPVLRGVELELCGTTGKFVKEPEFQDKMGNIVDGVYAVGGANINGLMSDIVFSNSQEIGCDILTLTLNSGATIVIQDTTAKLYEKVAYSTMLYVDTIDQDPYYTSILNQVKITVLKNFTEDNKVFTVYPQKP